MVRQSRRKGKVGEAQDSGAGLEERRSQVASSEEGSWDRHPRKKRPATPPKSVASVSKEGARRTHERSVCSRAADQAPRDSVQEELEQILRPRQYDDKYTASPFIRVIEDYPLPRKFKIPTIEMYDITTDPEDHLSVFLTHMRLQTVADEIRCKTFPMFLKGRARLWFQGLPPGSIRTFSELARRFVAQFVSSKTYSKKATHLMTIRQRSDETLKAYMTRFNIESLQVGDKDEKLVMAAFMSGLRAEDLYRRLTERPPKDLEELFTRAHAGANADEAARLKR